LPALPQLLTHLKLSDNIPKMPILPYNLKQLILGEYYHNPGLKLILPDNLTHLRIGFYPISITKFPKTLTHLSWWCLNTLPALPNTLINLSLYYNSYDGTGIDYGIKQFPHDLAHLRIVYKFEYEFPELSDKLTHLNIDLETYRRNEYSQYYEDDFYNKMQNMTNLTHLTWNGDVELFVLPASLTHLIFGHDYNYKSIILPSALQYLKFYNCECELSTLPQGLKHVIFSGRLYTNFPVLPLNLTHLTVGYCTNYTKFILPDSLTYLSIGYDFGHDIVTMPPNLITLICHSNIKLPMLPNKLQCLKLGTYYRLKIPYLPKSIRDIRLSKNHDEYNTSRKIYGDKVSDHCI